MIVLDLYGDRNPVWKRRDAFYGKPWIWNVLYNFGGKVTVNGDLPRIAANLDTALRTPEHGRLDGLGMMMEGLGYNPIVPDFVLGQIWHDSVADIEPWTRDWVTRRYGRFDPEAWNAWQQLLATAYRSAPQTGTFLVERPQFYHDSTAYRSQPLPPYDEHQLVTALDSLLAAAPRLGANDAYRYDVVNLTRQVLGQLGLPLVDSVEAAYNRKDRPALIAAERRVLGLLGDLDTLVGTRREFLLGRWLDDAKHWGSTDSERALYEWNARNIITLWGTKCTEGENDDLNLYAHKEWQGMFSTYYLPRWREFFRRLNQSLDEGRPFDRAPFAAELRLGTGLVPGAEVLPHTAARRCIGGRAGTGHEISEPARSTARKMKPEARHDPASGFHHADRRGCVGDRARCRRTSGGNHCVPHPWDTSWIGRVSAARYRAVFNASTMSGGAVLDFVATFLDQFHEAHRTADRDTRPVVVFRRLGTAMAFNDAMWTGIRSARIPRSTTRRLRHRPGAMFTGAPPAAMPPKDRGSRLSPAVE